MLLLHHGAIGDFLLTMSLAQAVGKAAGINSVTAIAPSPVARLAAAHDSIITEAIDPESVGFHALFSETLPLRPRLAELLHEASLVLNCLGGPEHVVARRLARECRGQVVSIDPRPTPQTREAGVHITSQWADDARKQGLSLGDLEAARIQLTGVGASDRIVLHPGSGGRDKCWPLDHFTAVADRLTSHDLAWMLGPADLRLEKALSKRDEPLIFEEDLAVAATHVAAAERFIGNDSGMSHLAAALGVPTLAIFTATDPRLWRPLGDHVTVQVNPEVNVVVEWASRPRS